MNIKLSAREITAALFTMLLIGGLWARANAATAVSACGTLAAPGNYFLTKNLSASGDCLVIGADNVAIDLKGKTITGNGGGSGITDSGIQHDFAIIANGKIRNFDTGILLDNSGLAIISNVDASKNASDGIFIDRCCNTLSAVTANGNGGTGIFIDASTNGLKNIAANGNGDGGIIVTDGLNALLGSTVSNNTGIGAEMEAGLNYVIASNIQKNSDVGVQLFDTINGVIKSNTSKNGGDGIEFPSSFGTVNKVIASKSNTNGNAGIDISGEFATLSDLQANKNAGGGVSMPCRGSTASLTATKNTGSNLIQSPTTDGPCANVNLNAP